MPFVLFDQSKPGEIVLIGLYEEFEGAEKWIRENIGSMSNPVPYKIEAEDEWVTLRNTLQTWEVKIEDSVFQIALVNSERTP